MGFRDTKRLHEDIDINKEERKPVRQLPQAGHFKEIEAGAGSKTFKMDRRGIWMGSADFDDAPISLSMEGLFKLLSTAGGGGAVGFSADQGIWVGAEDFDDAPFSIDINGVFRIKAEGTGDKFIGIDAQQGIWLGAEDFDDAPFSVDMDGNIKIRASSVTEDTSISFYDSSGNLSIYIGFEDIT
jgi:hypothetical protein